jgi:hypothetical protein
LRSGWIKAFVAALIGAAVGSAVVSAHGGEKSAIHACVNPSGNVRITGDPTGFGTATDNCTADSQTQERPLDFAPGPGAQVFSSYYDGRVGMAGNTTFSAIKGGGPTLNVPPGVYVIGAKANLFDTPPGSSRAGRVTYGLTDYACSLIANHSLVDQDIGFLGLAAGATSFAHVALQGVRTFDGPATVNLSCTAGIFAVNMGLTALRVSGTTEQPPKVTRGRPAKAISPSAAAHFERRLLLKLLHRKPRPHR